MWQSKFHRQHFREILFYNKSVDISFTGKLDYEVGQVVELYNYVGRDKKEDPTNGRYIIGHITREYSTSTDENDNTYVVIHWYSR